MNPQFSSQRCPPRVKSTVLKPGKGFECQQAFHPTKSPLSPLGFQLINPKPYFCLMPPNSPTCRETCYNWKSSEDFKIRTLPLTSDSEASWDQDRRSTEQGSERNNTGDPLPSSEWAWHCQNFLWEAKVTLVLQHPAP
uniref:Uncharacterized protein n=1 Tax=Pipistrellus kuhlii TaxID=59472 RepID=A0A7J8B275_PIPKU|nr:hypothetical protein mPipKuh1_007810 [Pipistrellus kuhlii]